MHIFKYEMCWIFIIVLFVIGLHKLFTVVYSKEPFEYVKSTTVLRNFKREEDPTFPLSKITKRLLQPPFYVTEGVIVSLIKKWKLKIKYTVNEWMNVARRCYLLKFGFILFFPKRGPNLPINRIASWSDIPSSNWNSTAGKPCCNNL